ncbi:MAG: Reductase, partial [uncultured Frankineae bacterium]
DHLDDRPDHRRQPRPRTQLGDPPRPVRRRRHRHLSQPQGGRRQPRRRARRDRRARQDAAAGRRPKRGLRHFRRQRPGRARRPRPRAPGPPRPQRRRRGPRALHVDDRGAVRRAVPHAREGAVLPDAGPAAAARRRRADPQRLVGPRAVHRSGLLGVRRRQGSCGGPHALPGGRAGRPADPRQHPGARRHRDRLRRWRRPRRRAGPRRGGGRDRARPGRRGRRHRRGGSGAAVRRARVGERHPLRAVRRPEPL